MRDLERYKEWLKNTVPRLSEWANSDDDDNGDCPLSQDEAGWLIQYQIALESQLREAREECEEQARLLGMSGSREAKLLTELVAAKAEIVILKEDNTALIKSMESIFHADRSKEFGYGEGNRQGIKPGDGKRWLTPKEIATGWRLKFRDHPALSPENNRPPSHFRGWDS